MGVDKGAVGHRPGISVVCGFWKTGEGNLRYRGGKSRGMTIPAWEFEPDPARLPGSGSNAGHDAGNPPGSVAQGRRERVAIEFLCSRY